jgi:hypothetical protein
MAAARRLGSEQELLGAPLGLTDTRPPGRSAGERAPARAVCAQHSRRVLTLLSSPRGYRRLPFALGAAF